MKKVIFVALCIIAISATGWGQFSPQVRVGDVSHQYRSDIALDSLGNIYVVAGGDRGIYPEIFVSKSTDNGVSFGTPVAVTNMNNRAPEKPSIAITQNGDIHIVCLSIGTTYEIYYAKSTNAGGSFSVPVKISDSPASVLTTPKITAYGNNVYAVWHYGDTDYRIYLDKSIAGAGFGTDVRVNDITTGSRGYPSVTVGAGETIYVTWGEISPTTFIRLAKSINQGTSFSASVKVDDADSGRYPSVATFGTDTVYVAWEDYRNVYADVRLAKSINSGTSFGTSVKVNDDITNSDHRFPRVITDSSGTIYAVWQDGRNDNSTPDIYGAYSMDGGVSFSANLKINSVPGKANYGHKYPALTVTDKVYVAWQGTIATLSGWQIYFSKSSLATSVEEQKLTSFPTGFVLEQNFPNPFNPSTNIKFYLPSRAFVSLKVFDLIGRELGTLVLEELSAGNHSRQWNAANIPSGAYFYRLQAGQLTLTKKLVLLR